MAVNAVDQFIQGKGKSSGGINPIDAYVSARPMQYTQQSATVFTPPPAPTPSTSPSLFNDAKSTLSGIGSTLAGVGKAVGSKVASFTDFLDHAGNPNNRTFSEAFKHDLENFRLAGKPISPAEATVVNGQMVNQPSKSVAELNKDNGFYNFNRQASGAALSLLQGASGGIIKNTVKPEGIGEKVVDGVSNVLGSIVTLRRIGMAFDKMALSNVTVAKVLTQYPKVQKYVYPILKNIVGFDIYGQLDPAQKDRLKSLGADTATGVLFSAMGFLGKAKISIPANFAVGFGLAKLQGASNEDAFIAGGILAGLDTAGRVTQAAFATKFKDGSAEFTPQEARQAVGNGGYPDAFTQEVFKKSVAAEETGGTVKVTLQAFKPGVGSEIVGKMTNNPEMTMKGFGWNVEVVPGNGKPAALPGSETAPAPEPAPQAPTDNPIINDIQKIQLKQQAPDGNPTQPIASVKPLTPEAPAAAPATEVKPVVTRTKAVVPELDKAISNYVSDSGVSNDVTGNPQETAALKELTDISKEVNVIKLTQEQVKKSLEAGVFDKDSNGDIILYRAGNNYGDNRLVSATYDKAVADNINLGYKDTGKSRPVTEYKVKPEDIKVFVGGSEAEVLIDNPNPAKDLEVTRAGSLDKTRFAGLNVGLAGSQYEGGEKYILSKKARIIDLADNSGDGARSLLTLIETNQQKILDAIRSNEKLTAEARKNPQEMLDAAIKSLKEGEGNLSYSDVEENGIDWVAKAAGVDGLKYLENQDMPGSPTTALVFKKNLLAPKAAEPQDVIDKRDLEGDVMQAIDSGDMEGARALYDTLKTESGVKMAEFDALVTQVDEEKQATLTEIKAEIETLETSADPDAPTNVLKGIADKLAAHFKAPMAKWKITGKQRTYSTPDGEVLAVGGDATQAFDNLIYATDIEGFKKNIKVLHYKFDKVFTELNEKIQAGDIDGGDYDRFKDDFRKALESRASERARRGKPSQAKPSQASQPEGKQAGKPAAGAPKVTVEQSFAWLKRQIGDVFTEAKPVSGLWESKGNVLYIRSDKIGMVSWLKNQNFVENAQEAGGNNVIKLTLKPDVVHEKGSPNGGGSYATVGKYADIETPEKVISSLKSMESPEILRLAKDILGDVPTLKSFKRALGRFYSGTGEIKLNPSIFTEPEQFAKVLAHELGHGIDWMDEHTMKRGNILGRIASLRNYLKKTLPEYDGAPGELTTEDRTRLEKEAKALSKQEVEVTEEVVIETKRVEPSEIIAIWNQVTGGLRDPQLLEYIKRLSEAQKKQIVVAALKGQVPEWVKFMREIKGFVTRKVILNSKEDIRKLYEKMLKEEIEKRRLFDYKTMTAELRKLTRMWHPFDPMADAEFTKYRYSSPELYADAVSVLLNDPWLLQKEAPHFYRGFMNYVNSKPSVAKHLLETWNLLNEGEEAVFNKRNEELDKSFETAEQAYLAKEIEKQEKKVDLWKQIRILFDDKYAPVIMKTNEAIKAGLPLDASDNPVYALHGLNYLDGKIKNYVEKNFQPIFESAQKVPDGWNELGKILFYERVINERGELANPQGYDPKTAKDNLRNMEAKANPDDWAKLQAAKDKFRAAVQDSVKIAEDAGLYTPELIETMKANPAYATYQVIDYIDTYISAHVYQQVGTLKDIANPATSSVMKLISVFKAAERNKVKAMLIEKLLKEHFSDEIEDAKVSWNGKTMQSRPSRDPDKGLTIVMEKGKAKGYYIDRDIADSLQYVDNRTIQAATKIAGIISQSAVYRPLFTSLNLGFQTVNFYRDLMRYWKNVPDKNLGEAITSFPRALYRYAKAAPHAINRGFLRPDEIVIEMSDKEILGNTYNDMFKDQDEDYRKQIERVLEDSGIPLRERKKTLLYPIQVVLDAIEHLGNTIESLPKIAAYMELKGTMPDAELAEFIRTGVGSPDFRIAGTMTPVSNKFLLFSNAIKEGIKTDVKIAATRNRSRSGFWWKSIIADVLPKVLMALVAAGYFGKKLKKIMDGATEYDKTSYTVMPIGFDKDETPIYGRIPHDETGRFIGGITWKILNVIFKKKAEMSDFFQIFDFGAGIFPNMSPSITGTAAVMQYLSGLNPYDSFRGRYVIPDTEFKAGYKVSFPIFFKWLLQNQGAGILVPTATYGTNDPTTLQKFLNLPGVGNVLGRWIRVTDYGETEKENQINQKITADKANQTLNERELLDKALKDAKKSGPDEQKQIKADYLKAIVGEKGVIDRDTKTKWNAASKKFDVGMLQGTVSREMDAIISANTNDLKLELLKKYKDEMNADQYKDLIVTGMKYRVLSKEFIMELRKAKLY